MPGGRLRRPGELAVLRRQGRTPDRASSRRSTVVRASRHVAMAWWRERVGAPVRRAWLAVARRARKNGAVDLHSDVQTCGYDDVQVMWNMLSSERQTFSFRPAPEKRRRASFWQPSFWHVRSPHRAA